MHEAMKYIRAILFDLNGVFYVDEQIIPGGAETIEFIKSLKLPCRFTTNTTTSTIDELHARVHKLGLPIEKSEIISPSRAAVLYLRSLGKPSCHLLLRESLKHDFAEFPQSHTNPDVIVIGDIGDRWNFNILNQVFQMVMFGAKLVALHRGRFWQVKNELRLDIGAFVAGLEYATGHEAVVIGKPSRSFFELSVEDMGANAGETLMLGDDIEADVGGARKSGLLGALVKTGKYRPEIAARSKVNPDFVLESIADLPSYFQ